MKKLVWLILLAAGFQLTAQTESALKKHYEDYYRQMRVQGDVRGVINALTHLNLLDYSVERRDTLAYVYANNDQHLQALNLLGWTSARRIRISPCRSKPFP